MPLRLSALVGQNNDAGLTQMCNEKSRNAWVPLDRLSAQPSLRTRMPALEQQVRNLTQNSVSSIPVGISVPTCRKVVISDGIINDLKKQNQALKDQLTTAQKKSTQRRFSLTINSAPLSAVVQYGAAWSALACWACCCPHHSSRKKTTTG
ncbi:MAG: hypothetical protein GPOALKHO_001569 [Sodalis sp.]|nr:MAG: hypothetical protein GPOALKHO_001569 [Sodalis sp.]